MPDPAHVIAGRCTTVFEGTREQEQHGDMIVLTKPDNTVLVHDANGYQPVAWLTRPEAVTIDETSIIAIDGDQRLSVRIHETHERGHYPASDAGIPIGTCPACAEQLVRSSGSISCPDCRDGYSVPGHAEVLESRCADCGLPEMRVEQGASFVVCLDRTCESLDERVREAFDREWACPDCDGDLRVLRRGGLLLGCDRYPDCETSFSFPTGIHDGSCSCGLPRFEQANDARCLDRTCEATPDIQQT